MPFTIYGCNECRSQHGTEAAALRCEQAHQTARRYGLNSLNGWQPTESERQWMPIASLT